MHDGVQWLCARIEAERELTLVPSTGRPILNSRQAADYLGVSLNTLYRIEKQGDLHPFRTPGGHRRYDLKMLDDYLEGSRFFISESSRTET